MDGSRREAANMIRSIVLDLETGARNRSRGVARGVAPGG
jgi:hypothetical protein